MTIPGIDGRKMSKSYGNQIPLSATAGEIRHLVFRIVTDSRSPAEPKDPDTILALYRHLAASADADELARRYRAGGGRLCPGQGAAGGGRPETDRAG